MIRWHILLAPLLSASLGGCGLLAPKAAEPDTLAKWAAGNAVAVGAQKDKPEDPANRIVLQPDGRSYRLGGETEPRALIYYVPLDKLDPALDTKLRERVFPGGVATVESKNEHKDAAPPAHKVSIAELDRFYIQILTAVDVPLCNDFTRQCDMGWIIYLVGKLKSQDVIGGRSLVLVPGMALDQDKLIAGHVGDAASLCGFDPAKEPVAAHIAEGCANTRVMTYAAENGFTVASQLQLTLVPLTPEALKAWLTAYSDQPMYDKGTLILGSLTKKTW